MLYKNKKTKITFICLMISLILSNISVFAYFKSNYYNLDSYIDSINMLMSKPYVSYLLSNNNINITNNTQLTVDDENYIYNIVHDINKKDKSSCIDLESKYNDEVILDSKIIIMDNKLNYTVNNDNEKFNTVDYSRDNMLSKISLNSINDLINKVKDIQISSCDKKEVNDLIYNEKNVKATKYGCPLENSDYLINIYMSGSRLLVLQLDLGNKKISYSKINGKDNINIDVLEDHINVVLNNNKINVNIHLKSKQTLDYLFESEQEMNIIIDGTYNSEYKDKHYVNFDLNTQINFPNSSDKEFIKFKAISKFIIGQSDVEISDIL